MPIELKIIANDQKEFEDIMSWFGAQPMPIKVEAVPENTEAEDTETEPKSTVLEKTSYFYNKELNQYAVIKKGKKLWPDAMMKGYEPCTKKIYDEGIAERKKASDSGESTLETETSQIEDKIVSDDRPTPTKEEVAKLIKKALDKGERLTVVALFARFEAERLGELAPAHYREFMDGLEAVV
ncbi:MAG: hypothetical protein RR936_06890 [Carnobacterium sp.]|uniref:hypothetical protein n=1 Tax=Carnobacterium sp. TaxID=48221 RepID=UPI002FCACDE9